MMARENLALIKAQIAAFHAAGGKAASEHANQLAGVLSALWVDAHPAAAEFRLETMRQTGCARLPSFSGDSFSKLIGRQPRQG
jgi:hypothetical protein